MFMLRHGYVDISSAPLGSVWDKLISSN